MSRKDYMRITWRRPLSTFLYGVPTPDDIAFTRWEWFLVRRPRVRQIVEYIGSLYAGKEEER